MALVEECVRTAAYMKASTSTAKRMALALLRTTTDPNMKAGGKMVINMDGEEIYYPMAKNGKVNVS